MNCKYCTHKESEHLPPVDMGGGMIDSPGCLGTPMANEEMCYCDGFEEATDD